MANKSVKQFVVKEQSVEIDENDLISLKDAANLAGLKVQTISSHIATMTLPHYEVPIAGGYTQRMTSRKAVVQFKAGKVKEVKKVKGKI